MAIKYSLAATFNPEHFKGTPLVYIMGSAGSGKTTVSTHLIAKRILTGEIKDVNKLIYTTYSK